MAGRESHSPGPGPKSTSCAPWCRVGGYQQQQWKGQALQVLKLTLPESLAPLATATAAIGGDSDCIVAFPWDGRHPSLQPSAVQEAVEAAGFYTAATVGAAVR